MTADAQALAAAGTGVVARRVHPVAHGQGKHRWTARLETAVVGMAGVTTYDQDGPDAVYASTSHQPAWFASHLCP